MTMVSQKGRLIATSVVLAAAILSSIGVLSVISAGAQTATTLPAKTNIYPTITTPDLKIPTVILTNNDGQQIYLRLQEYADGKGGSVSYSKFKEPAAPELTLKAGQVFTLKFINGAIPPTYPGLESGTPDGPPIQVGFDPSSGSDVVIYAVQLRANDRDEARFFLDTHLPASDDESSPAHGEESMGVSINFGNNINGFPNWVNYSTIVNVEGDTPK